MTFSSGLNLAYKPRSLAVDEQFQRLLGWVAERSPHRLRRLQLVDRGDYGWVEFLARDTQLNRAQAQRYSWRHGAYLALLFVLQATDFHYENFIVAGEHPVLVDVEAVFQPRLQDVSRRGAGTWTNVTTPDPLIMADAVSRRLGELFVRGAHDTSWIGLAVVNGRAFDLAPLAPDLYGGLPGVALY